MMVRRLVEQYDAPFEFSRQVAEEFLPAGRGMLDVALQDSRHDEDRVAVGQEVTTVEEQPAAPRQDGRGQRGSDVLADPLITGARRPDFIPRLAARAPQCGRAAGGSRHERHPAVPRPGGDGMASQDRRHPAFDLTNRGEEVIERRAVGADDVNPYVAIQRAQEIAINGRSDSFGGGFVVQHQFAQVAVALRENRPGRHRPATRAIGQGQDAATRDQADDYANDCLPAEHKSVYQRLK